MLLTCQFKDPTLVSNDFVEALRRLRAMTTLLASKSDGLNEWFSQGATIDEAFLYPAFEGEDASAALLAVLRHRFHEADSFTSLSIWNGVDKQEEGVVLELQLNNVGKPCTFTLSYSKRRDDRFGNADSVKDIVLAAVSLFPPQFISVAPRYYDQHQVFEDKPGAGWMLYLPRIITAQQLPEAQALIPTPSAGKKQTGTIIVSVLDEVFSLDNPRHVEQANRIELRLVDQDLIDRYVDMYESAD